jgi:hypothetical protein
MNVTNIKGFDLVMNNLNREISAITARSEKGLVMAAAFIRNQTETVPPLTPVDWGNLRISWFVVTAKSVPVGKGIGRFTGPKEGQIASEHIAVVNETQEIVAQQSMGKKKFIMMGYSVNYALYVHENLGMHDPTNPYWKEKKWRPNSGPKWFESAVKNSAPKILQIIKNNAQIAR